MNSNTSETTVYMPIIGKILEGNPISIIIGLNSVLIGHPDSLFKFTKMVVLYNKNASILMDGKNKNITLIFSNCINVNIKNSVPNPIVHIITQIMIKGIYS